MTRKVFEYALLRAVPRAERGECVNVGLILYCQATEFLQVAAHVDVPRLRGLDVDVDVAAVQAAVHGMQRTCEGAGPAALISLGQRFRWLTAPRSTVVRAGPVHSGLTEAPAAELERLLDRLVR